MVKLLTQLFYLSLYLLSDSALAQLSHNETIQQVIDISISELKPLQQRFGLENALETQKKFEATAEQQGISFETLVNKKPIEIILMPDGGKYILDRHHGAYAIWAHDPNSIVKAVVKYDFRSMSFDEASWLLYQRKLVYFNRADVNKIKNREIAPSKIITDYFPKSLQQLTNDIWRSYMGAYLKSNHIDAKDLAPFAEFIMIDELNQFDPIKQQNVNSTLEADLLIGKNIFYLIKAVAVKNKCEFLFL